jgi:crotonobetainyl-CoA:carnitine CoA-transferase CaiB-like acyl-CoA transferase/uncharacterized OB-fold protein
VQTPVDTDHDTSPWREPGDGPLAGVRVAELGTYMTGPYATMCLADLGADVIKIEAPGRGDPFRWFGRPATYVSAAFASMNRGKRSVVLDVKDPAGARQLLSLLSDADVLVCNWRAGALERAGLTPAALEHCNPRLISIVITGSGPSGPSADEPALDAALQARTGLMDATSPDGQPRNQLGYPIDKLTALIASQAALAALYQRERTGRGERVEVSMLDVGVAVNFPDLFTNRVFVQQQPDNPRNDHLSALRPLRAADGWLMVAPATSHQIRRALTAVGRGDSIDEVLSVADQPALLRAFFDTIESATPAADVAFWLERQRTNDVPAAPCLLIDDVLDDPQVVHNQIFRQLETSDGLRVRAVRHPAVFQTFGPLMAAGAAPYLGEHTDEVLGPSARATTADTTFDEAARQAPPNQVPVVGYLVLDGSPRLVAHECDACGAQFFGRRNACGRCASRSFHPRELARTGVVRSFTIVHHAAPKVPVPYVSAVIDLDGGGDVKANIVNVDPDPARVSLGMAVRLTTFVAGVDDHGTEAVAFGFEPR